MEAYLLQSVHRFLDLYRRLFGRAHTVVSGQEGLAGSGNSAATGVIGDPASGQTTVVLPLQLMKQPIPKVLCYPKAVNVLDNRTIPSTSLWLYFALVSMSFHLVSGSILIGAVNICLNLRSQNQQPLRQQFQGRRHQQQCRGP
jgi:hypothetical protein